MGDRKSRLSLEEFRLDRELPVWLPKARMACGAEKCTEDCKDDDCGGIVDWELARRIVALLSLTDSALL
jgi:hypothetical protein